MCETRTEHEISTYNMDNVKCIVCQEKLEFKVYLDYYISWSATCCGKFYDCLPHLYIINIGDIIEVEDDNTDNTTVLNSDITTKIVGHWIYKDEKWTYRKIEEDDAS